VDVMVSRREGNIRSSASPLLVFLAKETFFHSLPTHAPF
jgi:hypothetical protein